jgi:hypothetical protein
MKNENEILLEQLRLFGKKQAERLAEHLMDMSAAKATIPVQFNAIRRSFIITIEEVEYKDLIIEGKTCFNSACTFESKNTCTSIQEYCSIRKLTPKRQPTVAELEKTLDEPNKKIHINPDGSITTEPRKETPKMAIFCLPVVSEDDGMIVCKTGCVYGNGDEVVEPINEKFLVPASKVTSKEQQAEKGEKK